MTTANVEGQTFYRVRLGVFESMSEAKAAKAEIKDRYSIEAWIDVNE